MENESSSNCNVTGFPAAERSRLRGREEAIMAQRKQSAEEAA
jgi:hypothetical protein